MDPTLYFFLFPLMLALWKFFYLCHQQEEKKQKQHPSPTQQAERRGIILDSIRGGLWEKRKREREGEGGNLIFIRPAIIMPPLPSDALCLSLSLSLLSLSSDRLPFEEIPLFVHETSPVPSGEESRRRREKGEGNKKGETPYPIFIASLSLSLLCWDTNTGFFFLSRRSQTSPRREGGAKLLS